MIRVVLERPDQPPLLMVFSQPVVVVGRGETDGAEPVDWQLSYPDVSRRHCRLSCAGGRRFVEGLSERSPTYVNGRKTQGMTAIAEGDEIRFGYCVVRVCEDMAGSREVEQPPVAAAVKVKQGPRAEASGPAAPPIVRLPAPVSASVAMPSRAPQAATDGAVGEDVSILVERARHWDLRGRPAALLLVGPMLQRGRKWLRVGPELGDAGGLVRLFVERSAQARRSWLRRVGLAAGVTLTTVLTGSAVAQAWLPELRISEGPPPAPPPSRQCNNDVRERADALTAAALQQGDDTAALLLTGRALEEARGGGCRNVATAEPSLRGLLAKRHSRLLDRHDDKIDAAVIRGDGSHVAAAAGGRVKIWDVEGQRPAVPLDDARHAQALAWSGDDRWLAIGARTGEVVVWDVDDPTQAESRKELTEHRRPIEALAFSPEGGLLASADGGELRLWDMGGEAMGEPRGAFKELTGPTTRLQFNEAASRLFGLSGGKVRIWPIAPSGPAVRLGKPTTLPADGAIVAMAVDQEGRQIITGDTRGVVLVWRSHGDTWTSSAGTTHAGEIVAIQLRPRQGGLRIAGERPDAVAGRSRGGAPAALAASCVPSWAAAGGAAAARGRPVGAPGPDDRRRRRGRAVEPRGPGDQLDAVRGAAAAGERGHRDFGSVGRRGRRARRQPAGVELAARGGQFGGALAGRALAERAPREGPDPGARSRGDDPGEHERRGEGPGVEPQRGRRAFVVRAAVSAALGRDRRGQR
jgi:hypothetical protein